MPKNARLWALFVLVLVVALGLIIALISLSDDDNPAGTEAADWAATTGTLEVTAGEVVLTSGGTDTTHAMGERVEVRPGDQIAVSAEGEALLTFFTGQQSRLAPGSQATVTTLEQSGELSRVKLDVVVGQALSSVEGVLAEGADFEVVTPTATITVRGTQFVVAVRENQLTQVVTTDGTVAVIAGDNTIEVPCGYGVPVPVTGMGELKVWGQARLEIETPVEGAVDVPVVFTSQDNGQTFYFRSGDLLTAPLGAHDLLINTPGPVRLSDIEFPEDTVAETVTPLPVIFSAAAIAFVDDAGEPVEVDDQLLVTLQQEDLVGHAIAAPGEPMLVGPGAWDVTVALASDPTHTQTLNVVMPEGESATASIPLSGFAAE